MRKFTLLMLMVLILPLYAMADYNHALSFTTASTGATGDRLVVPLSALSTDDPYQGDATVSLWFRQEAMPSSGGVVLAYTTQSHDNDNGAVLLTSNTAGLKWVGWGQDQRLEAGTVNNVTVSLNEWHNLTLVISNTDKWVKVYLDNELTIDRPFNEKTVTFDLAETYDGEGDGAFTFGGFNFKGSYDEISFFNRALTAEEVAEAADAPESMAGLTAMYDFQEIVEGTIGQFANIAGNDNATIATYKTNRGQDWGSGVAMISSESEAAANISYITEETARQKSQAVETHTLTINTNGQGAVTITDGTNTYASGDAIPATADLTLTFAPAEGWTLASAVFAGGDFDGYDLVELEMIEDGSYVLGNLTTDLTLNVTFEEAATKAEYCRPEGNASVPAQTGDKGIENITVTDDKGNSLEIEGSGTGRTHALYTDATDQVFVTEPGATINIQNSGAGSWMSTYVYIDYNGNGTFDFDADKCDENIAGKTGPNVDGELVSHTGYNTARHPNGNDTADPSVMCDGTAIDWTKSFNCSVPAFTLPADLAPGDYRIRHKIDWNSVNPCGRVTAADLVGIQGTNNYMGPNGGGIIDFTLRIEEPKVNTERLTVEVVGEGSVRVVGDNGVEYDPAQADIPWYTTVKLFATPAAGWSLKSVDVGGEDAQPAEDGSYLNMEIIMTCNVTVTFEENPKQMIYIYQPQNNGGKIQVFQGEKELQHQDYVAGGAELRAVATPNEGFEFSKFKHNNADVDASLVTVDEAGVATYTFNMSNDAGLGIEAVFTETTGTVTPVEYCTYADNVKSTNGERYTDKITVKINDGEAVDYDGLQTTTRQKIYWDKTETVITAAAGDELTVTVGFHGVWMHSAVMIDYNKDGEFLFDVNEKYIPSAQSEVEAFTGVVSTADKHFDSNGVEYTTDNERGGRATQPMTFTLPANLAPGDYRFRAVVNWNKPDVPACPATSGDNPITNNGGIVADFTLRIETLEPREVSVKSNDAALGTVAIVSPETTETNITTDELVTVKATATDADAYFVNWTNATGDVVSTDAEYTYNGKAAVELTANFRQHYLLTVVDAENGTTVKAGTTVVASGEYVDKGTELTVTCSVEEKILKSLMINEVEKVDEYVATGYVFTMNEATSIEVEFAMPVYEVGELAVEGEGTLVVAEGVTAEGAPSGATFAEGAELEKGSEPIVIATPAANYKIESMIVDGFAVVTDGEPMVEDEYVSTYADGLIVAYQAYIEGSLKASVKFVHNGSAIESIGADEAGDAEFFNLQGIRVARENLVPGIYIMRNAEGARKVSVK